MSQTEPANIYLWVGGYTGHTGQHSGWTNGGIASSNGYWINWADGSTTDKGDFSYSPYCWNFPENWVLYHPPVISSDQGNDINTTQTPGIFPGFSRASSIPGARDRAIFDANVSGVIKDITLYADTRTGIRPDIAQAWKNKFRAAGWYAFATTPVNFSNQPNSASPGGLFVPYAFPYRISCLFGGLSGDGYTHGTNPNPEHYQRQLNPTALAKTLGLYGQEGHDDMNVFYEGVHSNVNMGDPTSSESRYHWFPETPGNPAPAGADSRFDGRGNKNTYYAPLESIRIGYAYRKNGIGAGSNVYYAPGTPVSLVPHMVVPLPKSGWAGIGVASPMSWPSVFNRTDCATYYNGNQAFPPNWPGFQGSSISSPIPPNLPASSSCGPKTYSKGIPGWHMPGATLGSGSDLLQFVTPDLPKHPLGFRQGEIGVPLPTEYKKDWNMSSGWQSLNITGGDIDGNSGVVFEGSTAAFYRNSQSWFKTHIPGIGLRVRADEIIVNDHAWRNGYTANSLNDGANINIHAVPFDSRYLGGTAGLQSTNWNTTNVLGTRFLSTSNFQTAVRLPVWWQWTSWGMLGGDGPYGSGFQAPPEGRAADWYSLRQLFAPQTSGTTYLNTNKCDVLPPLGQNGGPTGPWLSSGSHQMLLSGYWGTITSKSGYLSVIGATASVATGVTSSYIKNYECGININNEQFMDNLGAADPANFSDYARIWNGSNTEWWAKKHLFFYYPYTNLGTTGSLSEPTNSAGTPILSHLSFPANCVGAFISNTNFGHLNIGVNDAKFDSSIRQTFRSKTHLIRSGVKVLDGARTLFANEDGKFVRDLVSSDGIQVSGWETMSPSNCLMIGTFDNNYGNKPVYAKNFTTLEAHLNMTAQSEGVGVDENISLNMKYNMGPIVRMGGNLYVNEIRANGGYVGVHPNASGPISILDGYVEGPTLLDLNYKSNSSGFGLTSNQNALILGNSNEGSGIKVINTNIPSNWSGTTGAPVMYSADENVSIYGYGSIICDSVRLAEGKVRIIPDSYNAYRIRDEIKGATASAHYSSPI